MDKECVHSVHTCYPRVCITPVIAYVLSNFDFPFVCLLSHVQELLSTQGETAFDESLPFSEKEVLELYLPYLTKVLEVCVCARTHACVCVCVCVHACVYYPIYTGALNQFRKHFKVKSV